MLGHAKLETKEIYTRVSIRMLKQIHRATHPAKQNRARKELLSALAAEAAEDKEDV